MAREFVKEKADLIVAFENQTMRAAKGSTSEIPVVFLHVDDPVANGWVQSFARPGGNMTGFVGVPDLPDKKLEFFKEAVPDLHRLLFLIDPQDPANRQVLPVLRRASAILNIQWVEGQVTDQADIERLFASLSPDDIDGVFIVSPNLQIKFQSLVIRRSLDMHRPFMSFRKEWVQQGALL